MSILKLAIQKKGRLSEKSIELINECAISFPNSTGKLVATCYDFPLEILFLRDDDIPDYVQDGVADIGIVGENVLVESDKNVDEILKMGFGRCRLSLAVPRSFAYTSIQDLQGKSIATSYPKILQQYLDKNNIQAEIHIISGSVEIAPSIGLADAICDIVSTGSTLLSNGLKEVEQIFQSEAIMIGNKQLSDEKKIILDDLLFRLNAVKKAKKMLRKAFENAMANKGTSIVEFVSTCNAGWKMTPEASNDWMVENMFPEFGLGDLKDR